MRHHEIRFQVRYTGFRDRPREERQIRFQSGVREGHTDIAFVANGTNLQLMFSACPPVLGYSQDYCDFTKERGKVSPLKLRLHEMNRIRVLRRRCCVVLIALVSKKGSFAELFHHERCLRSMAWLD